MNRKNKLLLNIVVIYLFLITGFLAPLIYWLVGLSNYDNFFIIIVPGISVLLVAWFQKSASQLLQQTASFAIPGVYELRKKHLTHVNKLEKKWLFLAIWAIIIAVLFKSNT